MSFLYSILNVLIPVSLLTYQSLTQFKLSQQISYGKWALMIVVIYLFNWISWIFNESYIIFFLDLLIKIAISFIPKKYNQIIEQQISNLHLQIWLDQYRCWLIGGFHKYYWKFTQYLLTKMENYQSQQFRQGLLSKLNGQQSEDNQKFLFQPVKHYVNAAVNCDKLSTQIAQNISQTAKRLQQFSKKIVQDKNFNNQHNETFGQIKPTRQTEQKPITKVTSFKKPQIKKQELPKFHYKKQEVIQTKLKKQPLPSLNLRASQQQIDESDNQDQLKQPRQVISPIHNKQRQKKVESHVVFKTVNKKNQQVGLKKQVNPIVSRNQQQQSQFKRTYTFTDFSSSQLSTHPDNYKKAYKQDGDPFSDELINKLQLSSSQYSDMFDQEDDEDLKNLECKVQVILQIGSGPSARLEIYNLQLYSNSDLRIVSLYERQFESHKLQYMKPLPNNYYELIFEQGKVPSRKCKFRGQYQAFMKYIRND